MVSIDILRGLAILLMVQDHCSLIFVGWEESSLIFTGSLSLGLLAAPIFSFIFGLSLFLWMEKKGAVGGDSREVIRSTVRRGLFLFLLGLVLLTCTWGPDKIFTWDILTFLGTSAIILVPVRTWSARRLIILAFVVIMITPPLRTISGCYSIHEDGIFWDVFTLKHVVLGWLIYGFFPLFPWIAVPVVGFAAGKLLTTDSEGRFIARKAILLTGIGFACMGIVSWFFDKDLPSSLEGAPAKYSHMMLMIAVACIGFWILNKLFDSRQKQTGMALAFFKRQSLFSLSVYVVHLLVFTWSVRLLAIWENANYYDDSWNKFPPAVAIPITVFFIIVWDWVLRRWEAKRAYSIEGFLHWLM